MIAVDVSAELLRAADAVFDNFEGSSATPTRLASGLLDIVSPNWIVDLDRQDRITLIGLVSVAAIGRSFRLLWTPTKRAWIVRVAIAAKKSPDMRAAYLATSVIDGLSRIEVLRMIETFVPYTEGGAPR